MDLNPGPQDGRRRIIHGTMADLQLISFVRFIRYSPLLNLQWANLCLKGHGALKQKEINNCIGIGPTVKHVWNSAMNVLHTVEKVLHKHNSLVLGLIQSSSPTTKELHGQDIFKISTTHCSVSAVDCTYLFLKMGQSRALIVYFRSFHIPIQTTNIK